MEVTLRDVGAVAIVDLNGNLTIGRGDVKLREAFAELLRAKRTQIVFNLQGVQYLDSAGIGELVACSKRARAAGVTVKLLRPSPKVREMLEITRFADLFDTHDDEQEVLRSF